MWTSDVKKNFESRRGVLRGCLSAMPKNPGFGEPLLGEVSFNLTFSLKHDLHWGLDHYRPCSSSF